MAVSLQFLYDSVELIPIEIRLGHRGAVGKLRGILEELSQFLLGPDTFLVSQARRVPEVVRGNTPLEQSAQTRRKVGSLGRPEVVAVEARIAHRAARQLRRADVLR